MEIKEFVNDLLDKHGYFVNVTKGSTDDDGTILTINYGNQHIEDYVIVPVETIDHVYIVHRYNSIIEDFYLPKYLMRIYIFLHIVKVMQKYNLKYNSIRFINEKGEHVEEIRNLLEDPVSDQNKALEKYLDSVIQKIFVDKKYEGLAEEELRKSGCYHGFNMIRGLLI